MPKLLGMGIEPGLLTKDPDRGEGGSKGDKCRGLVEELGAPCCPASMWPGGSSDGGAPGTSGMGAERGRAGVDQTRKGLTRGERC